MNNYIEGIIVAYDRIFEIMNDIDAEMKNESFNYLRQRITASILAYKSAASDLNMTPKLLEIFSKYS